MQVRIAKASKGVGITTAFLAVTGLLLSGCSPVTSAPASDSAPVAQKLTQDFINGLCDSDPESSNEDIRNKSATLYLDSFQAAVNKVKDFGKGGARLAEAKEVKKAWGIDPENQTAVDSTVAALKARADVACSNASDSENSTPTGLETEDGDIVTAPLYSGPGGIVVDPTGDPLVPSLVTDDRVLNGEYRGQALFTDWKSFREVIKELDNPDWYINSMNALKAEGRPTFTWDDTAKFADAAEAAKLDVRVIEVYNISTEEMDDNAIRNSPEIREMLGDAADDLHIKRYGNFWNTLKGGTYDNPTMQPFLDGQRSIRVSMAPLVLNDDGSVFYNIDGLPVIDDRHGAGIFVDCVNIHWFEKYISTWVCTGSSCAPPPEIVCAYNPALPADSPNCKPKPVCPYNPALPPDSPDCLEVKNAAQGSAAQLNAPIGQGENNDKTEGAVTNPTQPPAAPLVVPPAPAPVVPAPSPADPVVPTPDPAPPAVPEPEAPAPPAPEVICDPSVPGVIC